MRSRLAVHGSFADVGLQERREQHRIAPDVCGCFPACQQAGADTVCGTTLLRSIVFHLKKTDV
jgi:hypothetical protein